MKEIAGIVAELVRETDWKEVGADMKEDAKAFKKRVAYEASLLRKMSPEEFKDFMINGEKHLGKLYRSGKMATVRREWRGIKDTGYIQTQGYDCGRKAQRNLFQNEADDGKCQE